MAGPAGAPADEFLNRVRQALGRTRAAPDPPYPLLEESIADLEAQVSSVHRRLAENRPAMLDRLLRMAELGGWNVCRALDYEEAIGYVGSLASSLGVKRVVRSAHEVFGQFPLDAALMDLGLAVTPVVRGESRPEESLRQEMADAGMGITGADYAVAETGSVVLLPRRGLSRLVSLLPPVHLALVRPQEVVDTLDDLFLLLRLTHRQQGGELGSYLNFITGPSRTADIEQTLVVGVHGPKEVHLVLLE